MYEIKYNCLFWILGILLIVTLLIPSLVHAKEFTNDIVLNPTTNKIYVDNSENRSISVIDGKTDKVVTKIPLEGSAQHQMVTDPNIVIQVLTLTGGFVTAFVGLRTYYQSQTLRKKDILKDITYPLMKEFYDSETMTVAKQILDDILVPNYGFYDEKRLFLTLRDHRKITVPWNDGDDIVRGSFDTFLDFLTKLESLISIKLVTKKELDFFLYFINKAGANKAVINYIRIYKFPLYGKLHTELDSRLPITNRSWQQVIDKYV